MTATDLKLENVPPLTQGRLVMGFSGWMNGGEVSTGTVQTLADALEAKRIGEIDSDHFYIYSFPGPMEIAAMFRPHGKIEDGLVTEYVTPENHFLCAEDHNLVLFNGKEPNLHWRDYADCVFEAADRLNISSIYFVGSVAGLTTHTREPRIMCGASSEKLRDDMKSYGMRMSNYEGPVSMVTHLMAEAGKRDIEMLLFVVEIPAYIDGRNPKCIEVVTRLLASRLQLPIEFDQMRQESNAWEKRVGQAVNNQEELAAEVRKLEEAYDEEVFDTQMDDLKAHLQQRGIRLD